jgi:hypothetical protein
MSTMSNDPKIRRLIRRFGVEGYGVYNYILELIVRRMESETPLPDLEENAGDIAADLSMDTVRVEEIVTFCVQQGLFQYDHISGRLVAHKVYKFLDQSTTRSVEIKNMLSRYKSTVENSNNGENVLDNPGQSETVSDSPGQSDTVSDKPGLSEAEQNRTEQNRTESEAVDGSAAGSEVHQLYLKMFAKPIPPGDYQTAAMLAKRFSLDVIRYELERAADKGNPIKYIHSYMAKPGYEPPVAEIKEANRQQAREEFEETEIDPDMMDLVRRSGAGQAKVEVW